MKKILLFVVLSLLLTSCVNVKYIDYTNDSTAFDKTNQGLYLKLLNDINLKYVYINNINDFDEYLQHINTLSEISYTYIKDSEKLTEETIKIEIDLQEKIIKTLEELHVSKNVFSSQISFDAANEFISNYLIKLINTRLEYLTLSAENLKDDSVSNNSDMSLIDLATIPNLEVAGKTLRETYLK